MYSLSILSLPADLPFKGSKLDPASYRGITLNSCLSKTFTAVLNNRLNKSADEVELISGAQARFRSWFSTVDNIFVLHSLIAMYFSFGKKKCFVLSLISKVHSTQFGD
jgi:hypothetical protein